MYESPLRTLGLETSSITHEHLSNVVVTCSTRCRGGQSQRQKAAKISGQSLETCFVEVTCGLVRTGTIYGRVGEPFRGCVKSETAKKRPSAKIDGTRSRALRGARGVKTGVKTGGFWQPLSQDVVLCWKKSCLRLHGYVHTYGTRTPKCPCRYG